MWFQILQVVVLALTSFVTAWQSVDIKNLKDSK